MIICFVSADERYFSDIHDALKKEFNVVRIVLPSHPALTSKFRIRVELMTKAILRAIPLARVAFSAGDRVVFVCSTAHFSALIASTLFRCLARPIEVYLYNFYLHELGNNKLVRYALHLMLSPHVGVFVQSPNEVEYLRSLNGHLDIAYWPYCLPEMTWLRETEVALGDFVFAGGYTNRDYDILIRAANRLPRTQFVIVCRNANRMRERIPSNVRIIRGMETSDFHRLMAKSRLVVVPLKLDVGSSGQMVALAAMQMGKAVVYANVQVISQYFDEGISGIPYILGNVESLVAAIESLYASPKQCQEIGYNAREKCRAEFSRAVFEEKILRHILSFIRKVPEGDAREQ